MQPLNIKTLSIVLGIAFTVGLAAQHWLNISTLSLFALLVLALIGSGFWQLLARIEQCDNDANIQGISETNRLMDASLGSSDQHWLGVFVGVMILLIFALLS